MTFRDGRHAPRRSSRPYHLRDRERVMGSFPGWVTRRPTYMKTLNLVRGAAVALATLGLMLPAPQVQAASGKALNVKTVDASMLDIGLQADGAFAGRVVDHTGTAANHAEVIVRQGSKEVARTTTDAQGRFAVKGLRGGVYEVASGKTVGTYRVWQSEVAPPAAKEQALLILGENGARGQFGGLGGGMIFVVTAVIATVIISAISLDRINEVDDKLDDAISP